MHASLSTNLCEESTKLGLSKYTLENFVILKRNKILYLTGCKIKKALCLLYAKIKFIEKSIFKLDY